MHRKYILHAYIHTTYACAYTYTENAYYIHTYTHEYTHSIHRALAAANLSLPVDMDAEERGQLSDVVKEIYEICARMHGRQYLNTCIDAYMYRYVRV
jgi:hypothetical protein